MGKYQALFILSVKHTWKNQKNIAGLAIFLITLLLIFSHLWKVVASRVGGVDLNPDQLLWYIAFNNWLLTSIPPVEEMMEHDLRSGRLSYQLPRPISYIGATFCEAFGSFCVHLAALGVVAFFFTWWSVGTLPFAPIGLLTAVIFALFAGSVSILFQMIVGLTAFWFHEVEPFFWLYEKTLFMFGGLILPLAVYPQWMQTIAHYTPFPAILGERSALAWNCSSDHCCTLFISLMIWAMIGVIALSQLYRLGLRTLTIEGG